MNEREEQLATQDVEARDEAGMNDYLLAPDPGHHNRLLDRGAAEHLREVAPGLAPDADGYLDPPLACGMQPERAKADAPRKGSKAWAIQEACRIVGIAFHGIAEYDEASDCFCSESRDEDYRNGGHALAFVEQAVKEKLAREKAPAPPAEAKEPSVETTIRTEIRKHPVSGYDYVHVERAEAKGEMDDAVVAALSPSHTVALRLDEINVAFDGPIPTAWPPRPAKPAASAPATASRSSSARASSSTTSHTRPAPRAR